MLGIYAGGANPEKIQILRSKLVGCGGGGVNSVSGEKLHDFGIICSAKRVQSPQPSPCTHACL